MTDCTQCGGTELVENALGKTIRCPECAGQPDPVAADGRTIEDLQAEVARLREEMNRIAESCQRFHHSQMSFVGLDPEKCGSGFIFIRDEILAALKGGA